MVREVEDLRLIDVIPAKTGFRLYPPLCETG